ncbi:hypothetical protein FXF51_32730 [Nonomuraea sp. PA05]|nr:hypothetical protein FXF51_32730 [Nonomuraea sp. PA05]
MSWSIDGRSRSPGSVAGVTVGRSMVTLSGIWKSYRSTMCWLSVSIARLAAWSSSSDACGVGPGVGWSWPIVGDVVGSALAEAVGDGPGEGWGSASDRWFWLAAARTSSMAVGR